MKLGSAEPMKLEPSYNQVQEISSNRTIERDLQKRKRNTHHRKLKKQRKKEKERKKGRRSNKKKDTCLRWGGDGVSTEAAMRERERERERERCNG